MTKIYYANIEFLVFLFHLQSVLYFVEVINMVEKEIIWWKKKSLDTSKFMCFTRSLVEVRAQALQVNH